MENTAQAVEIPAPADNEYAEQAWALESKDGKFKPIMINRGKCGDEHVKLKVLYCGVCHSDVHAGREFARKFPFVGGHEFLGEVVEVGAKVGNFKVGDIGAIGCMVDACLDCKFCHSNEEQYCMNGLTGTYNGERKHGRVPGDQTLHTFGGYSGTIVVFERFVAKIPSSMDLTKAAPLLCAGITMWDPLRHWGFTEGEKKCVGIIGVGGLGTMGLKLAKALGHEVVAISSSEKKEALAKGKGADVYVNMKSEDSVKACEGKCDIILNTVSANHDLNVYLPMVAKSGVLVQLGAAMQPHPVNQLGLMFSRKSIAGSLIGGMKSTQEMIDFCAEKNVYPDVQVVECKDLDDIYDKLQKGDADGLRFVLDIQKSLQNKDFIN